LRKDFAAPWWHHANQPNGWPCSVVFRKAVAAMSRQTMCLFLSILVAGLAVAPPAKPATAGQDTGENDATRHVLEARAIEAVIWGMPVVNYDLMYQAALAHKAKFNEIIFWSRPSNWKNQTLTPNPDAIYFMTFISTKDVGPVVLEIPPADDGVINGTVMDCWQTAIEDVGPAGVDKGKGGKYLVLPPGYKGDVPAGYIPLLSGNNSNYALLRSILKSDSPSDIAKAVEYGKRMRVYPLSQANRPPQSRPVDVFDELFDSSIPYDLRFFQSLDRMIQSEPWLPRDKAMIDTLKTIGIEKGKKFAPNDTMQASLRSAIAISHTWLDQHYEAGFVPAYFEGRQWSLPITKEFSEGIMSNYLVPDSYPIDQRGTAYSWAFFQREAPGPGTVLSACHLRCSGARFRRKPEFQADRPGRRPRDAVLVGDPVQPCDAHADSGHEVGEPIVAQSCHEKERRWLCGPLFQR
jgi:hypothetical protein